MADSDALAAAFEQHRDHLHAVAYRLLGSASDADDAVQDTWLRMTGADVSAVDNLAAWLTTVVARVSLNMLRSRRREQPAGESWPDAAETAVAGRAAGRGGQGPQDQVSPEDEVVLADSVGLALLVVLDTLTPAERLTFVLHDLFAMPFGDVAAVLGRSADATRQLASRARRRVRGAPRPGRAADFGRQRRVASAFLAASRGGDLGALLALLDADVRLTADAAAVPARRPMVLQGAATVSRGALASAGRAGLSQLALVNGSVGILFAPAGRLQVVLALTVSEQSLITAIDVIAEPERLRRLQLAVLPDENGL
ncbi:MAG TPA: sigma-70 family RNA polymerase sigma factor [Streptosporangiaceae bacterium]|jgi:RNA polymerase sigma-70 factor (ECF subfamily)|nr:sigma-70 family RNA polymerase sigma factor [Streptosporangiaceae bacterium]